MFPAKSITKSNARFIVAVVLTVKDASKSDPKDWVAPPFWYTGHYVVAFIIRNLVKLSMKNTSKKEIMNKVQNLARITTILTIRSW